MAQVQKEQQAEQQQPQQSHGQQQNRRKNQQSKVIQPKKEAILDLNRFIDKQIRVKFTNGREVIGALKGFDQLMNLVLDDVTEKIRDSNNDNVLTNKTRQLGLVVVRGPLLLTISPVDGTEVIENPFYQQEQPLL